MNPLEIARALAMQLPVHCGFCLLQPCWGDEMRKFAVRGHLLISPGRRRNFPSPLLRRLGGVPCDILLSWLDAT